MNPAPPPTVPPPAARPGLLSAREARARLGIAERTLRNWTRPHGPIPAVRVGRRVLYDPRTLDRFIAEREADGAAPPAPR